MAGIGLTLRKLVANQTYLHGAAAYFSSGVISAGPWLISVVSLALLQGNVTSFLRTGDRLSFFATITYAFIGSLILTGPIQIVLTRIIADHIFLHKTDSIAPLFFQTLLLSIVLLVLLVSPFTAWAPFDSTYRLLAGSLFVSVSLIWLSLSALSAAQDYLSIVAAFIVGYSVSVLAAMGLGHHYRLAGALAGFTLGQVICSAILINRIYLEFPGIERPDFHLLHYWREYWALVLVGLLYYLGQWAEKLFYWSSPGATVVSGFFRVFPSYDSATLLAYLLTIPASSVILVNLETGFYHHYHVFYSQVLGKKKSESGRMSRGGTLEHITRAKLAMIETFRSGLWTLFKVQGIVAAFSLLIAPDLVRFMNMPRGNLPTLCVALIAASGQVFVLYVVLLLLYLDARRAALAVTFVFVVSNLCLTVLATLIFPRIYGMGYLCSTLIAASLGIILLNHRLKKLEYITFMLQPIESAKPLRNLRRNPPVV